jgi:hypothetical protein
MTLYTSMKELVLQGIVSHVSLFSLRFSILHLFILAIRRPSIYSKIYFYLIAMPFLFCSISSSPSYFNACCSTHSPSVLLLSSPLHSRCTVDCLNSMQDRHLFGKPSGQNPLQTRTHTWDDNTRTS